MRKKSFLTFIMAIWLGCSSLYSQSFGGGGGTGGISADINFDLFTVDELSIMPSFLKVRYFVTDNIAARVSTWFDFESDQRVPESTLNFSYYAVRPGVEYHMYSSSSAGAYVGAEIIYDRAKHDFDTKVGVPVTGAWDINDIRNFENRGFTSLGAVLLGGGEIYKGGSFLIGTEMGVAFSTTKHDEVKYGADLFLGESRTKSISIVTSRLLRLGFMIN